MIPSACNAARVSSTRSRFMSNATNAMSSGTGNKDVRAGGVAGVKLLPWSWP